MINSADRLLLVSLDFSTMKLVKLSDHLIEIFISYP